MRTNVNYRGRCRNTRQIRAKIAWSVAVLCGFFHVTDASSLSDFPAKIRRTNQFVDCLGDIFKIADGLQKQEVWALKILDASTKFPSGVLTGHLSHFGNYDECLESGGRNLTTQHCLANFHLPAGNVTLPPLRLAYCLPESCPPEYLELALRTVAQNVGLNVTVGPEDCSRNVRERPLTTEEYVGITIWGLFVGLVVLSTLYDTFCRVADVKTSPILASFSARTNAAKLLTAKRTAGSMNPIHGLRFLSICWVVLGHRCLFSAFSSLLNATDFVQELTKIYAQFFVQGVLAVDTFFLLSGLLNCYNFLTVLDKTGKFRVFEYYVHRYIRLTPALAAIVLMYATWYVLIGDGPNWQQTTRQWKDLCVTHWWSTLLYINNYYNPTSQCAGQSWYLAVDMQLYWLSPLVLLPLRKWPKYGRIGLWVLLFASTLATFLIAYIYEFRAPFSAGFDGFDEFLRTTRIIYVPTHTRASPYIVGLIVGHYLYNMKKRDTWPKMSKVFVAAGWLVTTIVCLCILLGNYQFTRPIAEHPYDRFESSIYIALHRVGWAFAISWVVLSCLTGNGGIANDILSWKAFVPLSRLTYCIFLTHMAVQQYHIGTARTSDYFQYFNQVHAFFGDLIFSIVVAMGLTLTFESPILVIEKLIKGNRTMTPDPECQVNEAYEES